MLSQLQDFLFGANVDWAVCGGHAIDLFAGRRTREHKDVDVAVFWDQRDRLLPYLLRGDFRIFEPEGGLLREITCSADDFQRNDNLWCVARGSAAYRIERRQARFHQITTSRSHQDTLDFIEFLFNRRNGGRLIYKRNPGITHDKPFRTDAAGVPYLAPELVLLYKSPLVRHTKSLLSSDREAVSACRHDFRIALPLLDGGQRQWLAAALRAEYPAGHEWLDAL